MRMRTLITGGTGFVGRTLLRRLSGAIVTTRDSSRAADLQAAGHQIVEWNPEAGPLPVRELVAEPPQAVVNLMGASVAKGRWTAARKRAIRSSRVDGTNRLIEGLRQLPVLPEVLVNASAVGFYGDRGEEALVEESGPGTGFLASVCEEWETAARSLEADGVRVVWLRIGIVLGREGGALPSLLSLFRWGLGGRLGSGRQWMPWIHVDDLAAMIEWLFGPDSLSGPVNAVSPGLVTNRDFTAALAEAVHRPAILPAPALILRAVLGEFAGSLLGSQRVIPARAQAGGFEFRHATLAGALRDLVGSPHN